VVPDNNDAITAADTLDGRDAAAAPAVSGSDITSRIEQLFGEEKPSGESMPSATDDIVSDFTQLYAPGPSALAEEAAVSIAGSPLPSVEREPHPDRKVEAESQSLSGNDVTERLNEMFSDSAASIAEPLDEIGKMLDQHASVIDAIAPAQAGSEPHDDLPAKSIDLGATVAADVNLDESETPADTISGDDVAFRLDTIFEEGEKADAASGPGGATAVHDDVAARPRPEEDTRSPADAGDHAIVINGDLHEGDIHEMGEETLFSVEARAEETKEPDEEAAAVEQGMSIDDAVPQDEQPEMSGDDVAGRLDEIFSNDILNNEGAEPIPDGDKEDDVVNQGFYTMSGENAETAAPAAPGDGMLSELDKSEYEEPGNDTPVAMHDDVDKTVLMEHDGGDNTLAVAEEETMLSDSPKPPSGQPGAATQASGPEGSIADDDDVMVNGATQISLPTTDTDVQAQTDADADVDANEGTQFSIPDHVLTPTLADIYYQQGQPKLALQIYNRLLEADPDNDKLAKRTREIKDFIASQEAGETQIIDDGRKDSSSLRPVPAKGKGPAQRASGRGKTDGGRKPLAGVRIKKAFKSRIKKSR
jgi:hypothetical protein